MTPVASARGQHVALFGLGGSGLATARALLAGGASVAAWDDGEAGREAARAEGVEVADLREADWSRFAFLVLSPGVPLTHPEPHWAAKRAREAGLAIIGDVELFCRERRARAPRAPLIAVTGTNGKSTTTALAAHLLGQLGYEVAMGGNIGVPVLALDPPAETRIHVLELSSFQIDLTPSLAPTIGVLLNLTPDHIDRHGSMAHYAGVKARLVARADTAVVGVDDDLCRTIADSLVAGGLSVTTLSVAGRDDSDIVRDRSRILARAGEGWTVLADLAGLPALRGVHNAQNAAAAVAAVLLASARTRDDPTAAIAEALAGFPGLPHRMEQVGTRGRVLFVNDSKATNAEAAEQSLKSFEPIYWIVGGVAKDGGLAALAPLFPRVAKAYLIGKSSEAFAGQLAGRVPVEHCGILPIALQAAAQDAAASDAREPAVLLAPACASYDQYKNFEQRGEHFRALVGALPADPARHSARGDAS